MRNCKLRTVGENSKNSPTVVLRSSGYQLMNVSQDVKKTGKKRFQYQDPLFVRQRQTLCFDSLRSQKLIR